MKKSILILASVFFTLLINAQEQKMSQIPQVSVTGEGKIKVAPDQVLITLGVENTDKDANTAKKMNDDLIDKVLKYIKKNNIASADFQTSRVNLYKNYEYQNKKSNYVASQTITVLLKDVTKYNDFMSGITEIGINMINGVEFKSSKMLDFEREARKKAILNAKQKAEDYVSVLNQKIGKALLITDNSSVYYPPQPMFKSAMAMESDASSPKETIAIGEIEINANVTVSFILD
jgi:uncharacterized protein